MYVAAGNCQARRSGQVHQPDRSTGRRDVSEGHGQLDLNIPGAYGMLLAMSGPIIWVMGTGSFCHAFIASWYLGLATFS